MKSVCACSVGAGGVCSSKKCHVLSAYDIRHHTKRHYTLQSLPPLITHTDAAAPSGRGDMRQSVVSSLQVLVLV